MKIRNVQLREEGQFISLTADCKIRHIGTDRIYFKFEKKYRNFIAADASPFAAALFIPSMKMGQDLIIEGSISQKLQDGMQEIMGKMTSWNLGLKPISIIASEVKLDKAAAVGSDASFFSGGVDSFYTYLKRKDQAEKIDYLILANGFDISLDNPGLWKQTCKTVNEIVWNEDVEVIKVESNIRELIEPVMVWEYTHGGCLAALGLALRNNLKNIYIPSSLAIGQLMPYGSHPDLDPLWSTESLSFIHDGAEVKRVDKVKYIAQIPLALKHLRVCYINAKGKFNCGACDKCLRTMMSLRIADKLEEAETFPHSIDLELVKKMTVSEKQNAVMHEENLEELERLGIDPELQKSIRKVLKDFYFPKFSLKKATKKVRHFATETLNQIMLIDFFYNQSRLHKEKVYWQNKLRQAIRNISRRQKAKKKMRSEKNALLKKAL